jgi:hypothetical protein
MGGERIIEMTWRCSTCKRQNLGRYKSCQTCGNPKDGSEEFEMPSDTAHAPTVTDANLLRLAKAGPDWRCRFCGSDQRRLDGNCANCGAAYDGGPIRMATPALPRKSAWPVLLTALLTLGGVGGGCIYGVLKWSELPYTATVSAVAWEQVIDVERYALRTHEGFKEAIPDDAINVKPIGQRVHHTEKVQNGFTTQSFVDTVPDGTALQTYTVRQACGEDCTTTPQVCREVCRSNSNGFATCRQECSGGKRKCTTRYCSDQRIREVPKTRSQTKQLRIPAYRDEPRYADAFSYQAWSWGPNRTERETGTDVLKLRWPAGARSTGLPRGEQERERRSGKYYVTLKYRYDDKTVKFEVKTPAELGRYRVGSTVKLREQLDGGGYRYAVDGVPITEIR